MQVRVVSQLGSHQTLVMKELSNLSATSRKRPVLHREQKTKCGFESIQKM